MFILPLLAGIPLYRLFRTWDTPIPAFVRAAVCWGVLLLLLTELLSLIHAVSALGIAAGWGAVIVLASVALFRRPLSLGPPGGAPALALWVTVPAVLTLAVTLVIALVAPPNSTDSMTYHLARVAGWMQRSSVEPYATSTIRQTFMPPWAEYAILHFQLLAGGSDRLASLIQWLAFAGCLIVGSGIAGQLGGTGHERGLALLFLVSLPMVVVQASSTQSDLVTAFWCAVFAWAVLAAAREAGSDTLLLPAAALGLAVATKGTALVVCAPFGVWWLASRVRARGARRAAVDALALGAIVVLLNGPTFARNVRLFHHPLGPAQQRAALANAAHGPGALASNLLRNATLHLATPSQPWNDALGRIVERVHRLAGLDPQDPRTTWHENQFEVRILRTKESRTGNPLHFVLVVAGLLVMCARPAPRPQRRYAVAVVAGAVLFCWAFRWQQWHSRLHTPLFVLAGPLVAVTLGAVLSNRLKTVLGLTLWAASLPWLLANETRPLVPIRTFTQSPGIFQTSRAHQYFTEDPGIEKSYRRVVADLVAAGCRRLGVAGGEKTGVYPLVQLARARGITLALEYVSVENETRILEDTVPACALLVEEHPADWQPTSPYEPFTLRWRDDRVGLWLAAGRPPPPPRPTGPARSPGSDSAGVPARDSQAPSR
jgi:hypothetical protein